MSNKLALALCTLIFLTATPVLAGDGGKGRHKGGQEGYPQWQQHHHPHYKATPGRRHPRGHAKRQRHHGGNAVYHYGGPVVVWQAQRHRQPQKHIPPVVVARPLGHHHGHYHGGGHNRRQGDDWAVVAIFALRLSEALNDNQRHSHASAQRQVVSLPLGEGIVWNDGGAGGRIVATREGNDGGGRYCREYQQEIFVGQQRESGYGVACRQPDGAWEIVS